MLLEGLVEQVLPQCRRARRWAPRALTTEARVMRPRKPVPSAKVALVSTRPVTVLSAQAAAAAEISAVAVEERPQEVEQPGATAAGRSTRREART